MTHQPRRGSDVEAFLKRERDRYKLYKSCGYPSAYSALDDLLDTYRLYADTGTSLAESRAVEVGDNLTYQGEWS